MIIKSSLLIIFLWKNLEISDFFINFASENKNIQDMETQRKEIISRLQKCNVNIESDVALDKNVFVTDNEGNDYALVGISGFTFPISPILHVMRILPNGEITCVVEDITTDKFSFNQLRQMETYVKEVFLKRN